jgi:hypothetical protein
MNSAPRPPSWPARAVIALIRAYQLLLSPMLGQSCRFEPSCSQYAVEAVRTHGALVGSAWTVRRLLRCHPWHPGGADPVPAAGTRFYLWRKH